MNALYISYDGALDPLGPSQITPYVEGLSLRGIKFTLLTFEKKEKLRNIDKVDKLKKQLIEKNIKWEILRYHKLPTVPATAFDITTGILKGLVIVLRDNIKVIHARSFVGAMPALLLAKLFKIKFIFDMRGFWPDERIDGDIWRGKGLLYKVAKWWERLFLINADWIICLTEAAKKITTEFPYFKNKKILIDVIPTCVDTVKFAIRDKDKVLLRKFNLEDKLILVYFGMIGTWYMLEEMVDFFKVAKQRDSRVFFLLLTPDENAAGEMLNRKGVLREDYLINCVPYGDMPRWISLADASISFIRPAFSKKSSCPTKFAESLACGVPVIINPGIGDTEKIVRDYGIGIVVDNFTKEEYANAANDLSRILIANGELKRKCRNVAEDLFSLTKGVERYWGIYQRSSL